jgi:L-ribulose-5-phosphate 3-epimerase
MLFNKPQFHINRRDSLKLLSLGASALVLPHLLRAKGGLKSNGLKLAVQQYSFNRQLRDGSLEILDYPKIVVEGTGIKALEYFNGHIEDKAGDTSFFRELKQRCNDLGVTNTMMLCRSSIPLDSPDAKKRAQSVDEMKVWLEATKTLGGTTIRVDCKSPGKYDEKKQHAADGLNALCDVAESMKMDIVVENHGGHSSNGKWLAELMQIVNRPNCGSLPDFQNFKDYDPYQGVEDLMPSAKIVCAKSKHFDYKGNETNVDYERMMKIVLDAGFKGYIGIEFEGHDMDPIAGILATKKLIERIVRKA